MTTIFLYFTRITLFIRSYTCVTLFIVWTQTVIPYRIYNYNVTAVYTMHIDDKSCEYIFMVGCFAKFVSFRRIRFSPVGRKS